MPAESGRDETTRESEVASDATWASEKSVKLLSGYELNSYLKELEPFRYNTTFPSIEDIQLKMNEINSKCEAEFALLLSKTAFGYLLTCSNPKCSLKARFV